MRQLSSVLIAIAISLTGAATASRQHTEAVSGASGRAQLNSWSWQEPHSTPGPLHAIEALSSEDLAELRLGSEMRLAQAAPPAGAAGGAKYQVLVSSNMDDEQQATNLQSVLVNDGFTPVRVVKNSGGKFNVLIGEFDTQREAEGLLGALKEASYLPEKVVRTDEASPSDLLVSKAESGREYRVEVFEFADRKQAEEAQQQLKEDDYPAELIEKNGTFSVMLNAFASEDQARQQMDMLRKEGYPNPKVVAMQSASAGARAGRGGVSNAPTDIVLPADSKLPAPEQEQVRRALELENKLIGRTITAPETQERKDLLNRMKPAQRDEFNRLVSSLPANVTRDAQVKELAIRFRKALEKKDLKEAKGLLTEAGQVDSNHPLVAQMRKEHEAVESLAPQPANPQQVRLLLTQAETDLMTRDYPAAVTKLEEVLKLDPDNVQAKSMMANARTAMANKPGASAPAGGPASANLFDNKLVLIGGGALLLVLLVFALVLYQNTRREKELIRHVQELTSHTSSTDLLNPARGLPGQEIPPLFGAGSVPSALAGPAQEARQEEEPLAAAAGIAGAAAQGASSTPRQTGKTKKASASESDMVMISDLFDMNKMPKTPRQGEASSAEEDPLSEAETLQIPELNLADLNLKSEGTPAPPGNLPDFDIDELLKKPFPGAPSDDDTPDQPMARIEDIPLPPAPRRSPEAAFGSGGAAPAVAPAEEDEPAPHPVAPPPPANAPVEPVPAVALPSPATPPPAAAVASAAAPLFQQDFEHETVGEQPSGWRGEYDYATLTVDDRSPAEGSARCLRFEKRSGAGSANYVCNFPKATGQITVEFDIRCDDKNKYLLGFYVEKDEDFKQSVHTIVHRVDSKSQPTLRIQGEPIPYEFGTWRKVRYEVNLMLGVVNAFVDDAQVVTEAKLATVPAYLNTLSIRDNLATTGLLYLDNIRITRG